MSSNIERNSKPRKRLTYQINAKFVYQRKRTPMQKLAYRRVMRNYLRTIDTDSAAQTRRKPVAEKFRRTGIIDLDPNNKKIVQLFDISTYQMIPHINAPTPVWWPIMLFYYVDTPEEGFVLKQNNNLDGPPPGATEHYVYGFRMFSTGPTIRPPTESGDLFAMIDRIRTLCADLKEPPCGRLFGIIVKLSIRLNHVQSLPNPSHTLFKRT